MTSYFLPKELRDWKGPGRMVHVAPKTLKEVFDSIIYIGRTTKTIKKAENLVNLMKKEFARLEKQKLKTKPRVYMEKWPVPPMASGNWVPELVEIAGGIPVIAQSGKPSAEFAFAKLQKADPDVMIFHWCGYGERFNKSLVTERPCWSELKAVKQNKLFVIDDSLLNRPSPRLVEGIKAMQKILTDYSRSCGM